MIGLNPKALLRFLALLPHFTDPTAACPVGVQMLLLGLVHVTNCAVVHLLVGYAAHRVLRTRPSAARILTRISGITMILIALVLTMAKMLP